MSFLANLTTRQQIVAEVEKYVPVSNGFTGLDFKRFVRIAEEDLVFPIFPEAIYDALLSNVFPELTRFVEMLKTAIINYAMYDYLPLINANISASGTTETNTPKSKAASLETKRDVKETLGRLRFSEFEKAIAFAEKSTDDAFDTWKASPNYTVFKDNILKTAEEFSLAAGVKVNRIVFLLLKSNLKRAEYQVKQSLGDALFEALKIKTDDAYIHLNEEYIKPIIAERTMQKSIVKLSISFGLDNTIALFDNTSIDVLKKSKTPTLMDLEAYEDYFEDAAEMKQAELMNYLEDKKELFTEYQSPEPRTVKSPKAFDYITRF